MQGWEIYQRANKTLRHAGKHDLTLRSPPLVHRHSSNVDINASPRPSPTWRSTSEALASGSHAGKQASNRPGNAQNRQERNIKMTAAEDNGSPDPQININRPGGNKQETSQPESSPGAPQGVRPPVPVQHASGWGRWAGQVICGAGKGGGCG